MIVLLFNFSSDDGFLYLTVYNDKLTMSCTFNSMFGNMKVLYYFRDVVLLVIICIYALLVSSLSRIAFHDDTCSKFACGASYASMEDLALIILGTET